MEKRTQIERIWRIINNLRGNTSLVESLYFTISLLLIRRIDCLMGNKYKLIRNIYAHSTSPDLLYEELGDLKYYNYGGESIQQILEHLDENKYELAFERYVHYFNKDFQELLQGLNFDINLSYLKRANGIKTVLEELCNLDLTEPLSPYDIYFLMDNNSFGKSISEFTSPEDLDFYISFFLLKDVEIKKNVKVLDPVCGSNRLLFSLVRSLYGKSYLDNNIHYYGVEINYSVYCLAHAIQIICNIKDISLENANSLTDNFFDGAKFDYIVADLPYGVKLSEYDISKMRYQFHYTIDDNIRANTDLYFIQMLIHRLTDDGKAAVVTSGNILSSEKGADVSIRNWLFNNDYVESIIKLPFFKNYASVNRYLWILNKDKNPSNKERVKLVSADKIKEDGRYFTNSVMWVVDDPTSKFCKDVCLIDIASYKFQLFNRESYKDEYVEIPCGNDMDYSYELFRKGYDVTPKGRWEIQYNKTVKNYYVNFDNFFAENEEKKLPAKELYHSVQASLSKMTDLVKEIISLDIPQKEYDGNKILSGWAGYVPAEWQPVLLKELISCEMSRNNDNEKSCQDGDTPLLSYGYLKGETSSPKMVSVNPDSLLCTEDDIIMVRTGTNAGEVLKGKTGVIPSNLLFRIRRESNEVDILYLRYLLVAMNHHFKSSAKGTAFKTISRNDILSSVCYLPPLYDQKKISSYLRLICHNIDKLHFYLGVKIPQLEDFKESIVYELVTGKMII